MEEEFKPILCMVCLNVKSDEDCTAIEESIRNALDVLLLKLPIEEASKCMICNVCCTKVFEAFRFKTTCRAIEDVIFPYSNSKNGAPIDLKEIYLMEKGQQHLRTTLKAETICRLCMQIVTCEFKFPKDIEMDLVRAFIPEVNFNSTNDPIVCATCNEALRTHCGFLRTCLSVQKFRNACEDKSVEGQFQIKMEEIEIKSEGIEDDAETLLPADEPVVCKASSEESLETELFKSGKYECSMCTYQTKFKHNLTRHQLKHKELSEVRTYKCAMCDYITKRKEHLVIHHLTHKNISEVQTYKCDRCNFESKHKKSLVNHERIHKDISEVQMYRCHTCNYETKFKGTLAGHVLTHKDISEVQMHKCDTCSYETKYKGTLLRHVLTHQNLSETQMYKCDTCDYEIKRKDLFKRHKLKHRNISEVQRYKCDKCNFETKYKTSFVNHELRHQRQFEGANVHV